MVSYNHRCQGPAVVAVDQPVCLLCFAVMCIVLAPCPCFLLYEYMCLQASSGREDLPRWSQPHLQPLIIIVSGSLLNCVAELQSTLVSTAAALRWRRIAPSYLVGIWERSVSQEQPYRLCVGVFTIHTTDTSTVWDLGGPPWKPQCVDHFVDH